VVKLFTIKNKEDKLKFNDKYYIVSSNGVCVYKL